MTVAPARWDMNRWAGGGIILSPVVTKYHLGLVFHAGSLIVPPSASTPHGTWESAMNAALSASTSAAKEAWNLALSRNRKPSWGGRIGGTGAPGGGFAMRSALAPGADQLFIKAALGLNIAVEAVIPCAQYAEIFTSTELLTEYHRLLDCCQKTHQLPAQACSDDAYLEAGQWIVHHSDLLLFVWNGYPAGGRGGTADVASYARAVKRPFTHIHTRLHTIKQ